MYGEDSNRQRNPQVTTEPTPTPLFTLTNGTVRSGARPRAICTGAAQPAASAAVCQRGEKLPPHSYSSPNSLTRFYPPNSRRNCRVPQPVRSRHWLFCLTTRDSVSGLASPHLHLGPEVAPLNSVRVFVCVPEECEERSRAETRTFEWTKEPRATGTLPPKWKGLVFQ